jgi:hypothetical protein
MRRLTACLVVFAALMAPACKRKERTRVETIEEPFTLKSMIAMSDPRAAVQLVNGFYDVEFNAWRWTAGKFAVNLRPPTSSVQTGATLVMRFSVPQAVLDKLKSVTLSAKTGTVELGSETYSSAGEYVFKKEVPGAALAGESVIFSFELDKALPPGTVDQRELGLIVSSIGLEK